MVADRREGQSSSRLDLGRVGQPAQFHGRGSFRGLCAKLRADLFGRGSPSVKLVLYLGVGRVWSPDMGTTCLHPNDMCDLMLLLLLMGLISPLNLCNALERARNRVRCPVRDVPD